MKILYVIDHLGGGGAENQFVETVSRVNRETHEIICFLTEGVGIRHDDLSGRGVKIIKCVKPRQGRDTLRAVRQLRQLVRSFRPDMLHSYLMYSAFVSNLALLGMGRWPVFLATEFSSPERILDEVRFRFLKKAMLKWSYGHLDRLVTTSTGVKEEMVSLGYLAAERISVIHEGVDLERCSPAPKEALRRELGLPEEKKVVSVVSSLVERKGHRYLLEALSGVLGVYDDVVLYVLGDGPERGSLEARVRELKIEASVEFMGYRKDATRFINASDVFVLPSLYEGMPNVVLEAMALGTPVITTGMYGALDVIEDARTGLLVPPADAGSIRDALLRLLGDSGFYDMITANALERIKGLDFGVAVAGYERLYEEMLG